MHLTQLCGTWFACFVSSFVCAFDFLFSCTFLSFTECRTSFFLSKQTDNRWPNEDTTWAIGNSKRKKSYTRAISLHILGIFTFIRVSPNAYASPSPMPDARCPYFIPFVSFITKCFHFISLANVFILFNSVRALNWVQCFAWVTEDAMQSIL